MSWAAMVVKSHVITWPGVFVALGAICAILGWLALILAAGKSPKGAEVILPAAALFSLVLSRIVHWYCHPLLYAGFREAVTDFSRGGFSLCGVFAGVLTAMVLARGAGLTEDLAGLLDAAAPAGALGIAVGRLGALYDLSDRGRFLVADPARQRLPWAVLTSFAEGEGEWRFATFLFQAAAAAAVALALSAVYLRLSRRERLTGEKTGGRVFALFLVLYGVSQIVLDSTRYDGDFIRANGFVHLPQLLSAVGLAAALAWLSVRSVRENGLRARHGACWTVVLICLGLAGWMEYYVQRRADQFALAYGVMSGALALTAAAAVALCLSLRPGFWKKRKPATAPETAAQT